MKILIIGGGVIGKAIAEFLINKKHAVKVIEKDPDKCKQLGEQLDAAVIEGSALSPSVLGDANIGDTDLCLSLTGNAELNIVTASLAKGMGAKRVAARVYADIFNGMGDFDFASHFKIDRLLCVEHLTATAMVRKMGEPVIMNDHIARDRIKVQDITITKETKACGVPLRELMLPSEVRIGAIRRKTAAKDSMESIEETFIPNADTEITLGDQITIIGLPKWIEAVEKRFEQTGSKQSVTIIGGSRSGVCLAKILKAQRYQVRLLEKEERRANALSKKLAGTCEILRADARRVESLLNDAEVREETIFIAATDDDEDNVMTCLEAGQLGVKRTITLIRHSDYASVLKKLGLNETVSPYHLVQQEVESLLQTGPVRYKNSDAVGGGILLVELDVGENSPLTQKQLKDVDRPKDSLLIARIRGNAIAVPGAGDTLETGDIIVALVYEKDLPALIDAVTAPKK